MDHPPAPAVSVVTATRNRPLEWVRAALESIAGQTFTDYEALVVDDGSRAPILAGQRALCAELGPRFVFQEPPCPDAPGSGPARARNRGIQLARGRYVAFLDDDDHWTVPDYLAVAVRLLEQYSADFFIGNMLGESHGRATVPDWFHDYPWLCAGPCVEKNPPVHELSLDALCRTMRHTYPHPNGCVVRRSLLEETGLFWEKTGAMEDVGLIFRLADRARKMLYRPQPVFAYNITPHQSVYTRLSKADLFLQSALAMQHTRLTCTRGRIRATARTIEAWYLRLLARELHQNKRPEAARFAWQALCLCPSAGAGRDFLRTLW